ncbi:MAG: molybdopterin-binding protein [Acidimicrobiia bacterium]
MIVEVVAVGTELLIGQITNSNATHIGARLAEEGHDAHFQVTVGDNISRLVSALEVALSRSDAVVITGGIGPTQDDLTREAICQVAGRHMTRDQAHADWIRGRVSSQGGTPTDTVLRMADLPEGAEGLPNVNGVALGVAIEHEGKWLFAIPGVPVEMTTMLDKEVLPRLQRIAGNAAVLRSRMIRTWGMGESRVAELLDDLFLSTNPSVAFLITDMEVRVRITAKADDHDTAGGLIAPIEEEVRNRLGAAVFGVDDETVERMIVGELAALGWTMSTVEVATLGQVGGRIAAEDQDRSVFAGSSIVGRPVHDIAPTADVVLTVGAIGEDPDPARRTTRPVEMTVTTPHHETKQVFDFGGDDERVRSFATIAGLHLIRIAVDTRPGRS